MKNISRGFGVFLGVYLFFFAIPFPMIIYYSVNSEYDISGLKNENPWIALVLVGISILLWLILLVGYFKKWVLSNFAAKKSVEKLKTTGVLREAKILTSANISRTGAVYDTYKLHLSLKNLVGTDIVHDLEVNDTKPFERRFDAGKRISVLLNPEIKDEPYLIISTAQASINIPRLILIFIGWLLFFFIIACYYMYAYQTESHGWGWRFMGFWHPLMVCALVLLFYRWLLRFIYKKIDGLSADDVPLIKFKGIKTEARLISSHQTGTYINEQPMIRFELEYTDDKNQKHSSSLKKIVSLLDLDITKRETLSIFYLQEDPKKIAFATDIDQIS